MPWIMTTQAKYTARTADEENLQASDLLFARFVEAAHEKGSVLSSTESLTIAVLLTSGWMRN